MAVGPGFFQTKQAKAADALATDALATDALATDALATNALDELTRSSTFASFHESNAVKTNLAVDSLGPSVSAPNMSG